MATIGRRWIAPLLVLAALSIGCLATWMATTAVPKAAVAPYGGVILSVQPGGPGWEFGIRPQQPFLGLHAGDEPWDWTLWTIGPQGTLEVPKLPMIEALRAQGDAALLGLAAAALGALFLVRRPAAAAAFAVMGVVAMRQAMLMTGDMAGSSTAVLVALGAPAAWLLAWSGRRRSAQAVTAAAAIVGITWLLLRFQAAEDPRLADPFDLADAAVLVLTYLLAGAVALAVVVPFMRRRGGLYSPRRMGDILVLATVAIAVPLSIAFRLPTVAVAVACAALLVVYPLSRGRIGVALDQLVLGDLRTRGSVDAIERERQRMSREIHDQPLQELAVVIHRLASRPDLAAETAMLQEVTGQLRGVTMQLHPPILTDLGLGPSLEFLVSEMDREAAAQVRAEVVVLPGGRPPAEVELAAFRVAQEALTNAVRHSAARTIAQPATEATTAVTIAVTDDGVGLDRVAARQALGRGHVGLRSMDERAQLVGGELRIEGAGPGTRVSFAWPA